MKTLPELQPWLIKILLKVPTPAFFAPFPILYLTSLVPITRFKPKEQFWNFSGANVHLA